jgi:hypothetical protein
MHGAILSLPHMFSRHDAYLGTGYLFMAWYLVKQRDNFTFTFVDFKIVDQ